MPRWWLNAENLGSYKQTARCYAIHYIVFRSRYFDRSQFEGTNPQLEILLVQRNWTQLCEGGETDTNCNQIHLYSPSLFSDDMIH